MRKYAFDLVFDAAGQTTLREDRTARRFSQQELDEARAEGVKAGRADAQAAADASLAQTVARLCEATTRLEEALAQETAQLRHEAARLALAMAQKCAGRALEAYGAERALEAFDAVLEGLGEAARLVVRIAPAQVEPLRARLAEAAREHGFTGALVLRPWPQAAPGDIAIDWGDGATALQQEELMQRLESLLAEDEWGLDETSLDHGKDR